MHLHLRQRTSRDIPFGLIYGTIAFLGLAAARFLPLQNMLPSCAFKAFTGIPCPTCGTTRMMTHLAQGDLAGAFGLNPAVALAVISVVVLFVYDAAVICKGSRVVFSLSPREAGLIRSGIAAALLLNWLYLAVSL